MTKLWLLATNTIREVVRQKLFLNVLVFGVLMIVFAQVVANLTFGRADRVVRSIGLSQFMNHFISQIGKRTGLKRCAIAVFIFADDNRSPSPSVSGGIHAILC
mgnify:CR=1 FL=1